MLNCTVLGTIARGRMSACRLQRRQKLASGVGVQRGVIVLNETCACAAPCRGASIRANRRRNRFFRTRRATGRGTDGGGETQSPRDPAIAVRAECRGPCLRARTSEADWRDPGKFCCRASPESRMHLLSFSSDMLLNSSVFLSAAITKIVTFVNQHNAVTAQVGQLTPGFGNGQHFRE